MGRMAPPAAPAGQKRPAQDELEDEQRLSKRLGRLHIARTPDSNYSVTSDGTPKAVSGTYSRDNGDTMQVDDTKTRVFVHDLDSEVAELEAEELNEKHKIEFLPDIEKKLNSLPKGLLQDKDKDTAEENQQLVLYRVPPSLSIPEDKDSVRRAVVEARQRAADETMHVEDTMDASPADLTSIRVPVSASSGTDLQGGIQGDEDAMDID